VGSGYLSTFDKETEVAEAGYYAVTLTDYKIRAEVTAGVRAGLIRFTFPEHEQSRIQIDLAHRVGGISFNHSVRGF
jgi:putative alpha-1,2-mannosidase